MERHDFNLEPVPQVSSQELKVGQSVQFVSQGSDVLCVTTSQEVIGKVPDNCLPYVSEQSVAVVRALRKAQTSEASTIINIRVTFDALSNSYPDNPASQKSPSDISDDYFLSKKQLGNLAADKELQVLLKDERLQKVLGDIDGASRPEKVLEDVLANNSDFRAFADKLLVAVAPPSEAAG